MKRYAKIAIIGVAILWGVQCTPVFAESFTLLDEQPLKADFAVFSNSGWSTSIETPLATHISGVVNKIYFKYTLNAGTQTVYLNKCNNHTDTFPTCHNSATPIEYTYESLIDGIYTYSGNTTLDSEHNYALLIQPQNTGYTFYGKSGITSTSKKYNGDWVDAGLNGTIYYQIWDTTTITNNIEYVNPTDTETGVSITPDFSFIATTENTITSTKICVDVSQTSTVAWSNCDTGIDFTAEVPTSHTIPFKWILTPLESNTTYTATASIYESNDTLYYQELPITFTTEATGFPTEPTLPNSTSTIFDMNASCDSTEGIFANSLCKVFAYLFSPTASIYNQFQTTFATIKTKAPLGYFYGAKDLIASFDIINTTGDYDIGFPEELEDIFAPLRTGFSVFFIIFAITCSYKRLNVFIHNL
jgi:hypothetical protein